eukprot:scaffold207_cov409-Prasinococcus_capsulatus_cf.AAC.120
MLRTSAEGASAQDRLMLEHLANVQHHADTRMSIPFLGQGLKRPHRSCAVAHPSIVLSHCWRGVPPAASRFAIKRSQPWQRACARPTEFLGASIHNARTITPWLPLSLFSLAWSPVVTKAALAPRTHQNGDGKPGTCRRLLAVQVYSTVVVVLAFGGMLTDKLAPDLALLAALALLLAAGR